MQDGHPSLAAMTALEVSNNLVEIGKLDEAYSHYVLTYDIQQEQGFALEAALSLKRAALCKVSMFNKLH